MNAASPLTLEDALAAALHSLCADLASGEWYGREREVISLFAFGHLLPLADRAGIAPAQIGIEVAVPQVADPSHRRRNPDVCKDLVIWAEPRTTCWRSPTDKSRYPLAVMEWKARNNVGRQKATHAVAADHARDVTWLEAFVRQAPPGVASYAVLLDLKGAPLLRAARVVRGATYPDWLAVT